MPETPPQLPPEKRSPPEVDPSRRGVLVVFVAMVILIILGWLLVQKLQQMNDLQNCVLSGRKDCAPIETPSTGE